MNSLYTKMDKLEIITLVSNELRKCIDNELLTLRSKIKYHTKDGIFRFYYTKIGDLDEFNCQYTYYKDGKVIKLNSGTGIYCYLYDIGIGYGMSNHYYNIENTGIYINLNQIKITHRMMKKYEKEDALKYFSQYNDEYSKNQIKIINESSLSKIKLLQIALDDVFKMNEIVSILPEHSKNYLTYNNTYIYNVSFLDRNNVYNILKKINNKLMDMLISIQPISKNLMHLNKNPNKLIHIKRDNEGGYFKMLYKNKYIVLNSDFDYSHLKYLDIKKYSNINDVENGLFLMGIILPELANHILSYL